MRRWRARRGPPRRRLCVSCSTPPEGYGSRRFDVGVETEQVLRIVALLERGEPRVVVAVGGMHARIAVVGGGEVHVLAAGERLDLRPDLAHPVAVARGILGRHRPEAGDTEVVTRAAVEVGGGAGRHAADRATLM